MEATSTESTVGHVREYPGPNTSVRRDLRAVGTGRVSRTDDFRPTGRSPGLTSRLFGLI